jgi:cysteine synthase
MPTLGLETEIVDRAAVEASIARFREAGVRLPTFTELADPSTIPAGVAADLVGADADGADPRNLFRVHWYNAPQRGTGESGLLAVPDALVLPEALTGVAAPIVVLPGDRFPMIRAHKVLAAYACLVPRLVTGQFDPTHHRAIWPSTGNYCRGGVAISKILGCRGVAVLPAGMSQERFDWLEGWVADPDDIIRTPGTESNVKEIYDRCAELDREPENIIFNQFSEFGNYLAHWLCTGRAIEHTIESLAERHPQLRLAAFVSATGSAGTLAAGDYLKEHCGSRTVAVEALECPTLLYNGFGEHNIQGIGDKHVPLIHNVMSTDMVAAISDESTDALNVLFNSDEGHRFLVDRKGVDPALVASLARFGLSSICNVLAAIKAAHYWDLGPDDAIATVATDGAEMYTSEKEKALAASWPGGFDAVAAGEVFGRHLAATTTDHLLELSAIDRRRIFNLGYFTWVEQQGISVEDFDARRDPGFWRGLRELIPAWDERITEINSRIAAGPADS